MKRLPCGWKPTRGTWHEAVQRAERKRLWRRRGKIAFSVVAIIATLTLYFYGISEAWRHRPDARPRPKTSNEAVRFVDAAAPGRADDHNTGGATSFCDWSLQQGTSKHEAPLLKTKTEKLGGGRAEPRNDRTATYARGRA